MPRCLLAALIFCLLAAIAGALPLSLTAASPAEQCRMAIPAAPPVLGLPPPFLPPVGRGARPRRPPIHPSRAAGGISQRSAGRVALALLVSQDQAGVRRGCPGYRTSTICGDGGPYAAKGTRWAPGEKSKGGTPPPMQPGQNRIAPYPSPA